MKATLCFILVFTLCFIGQVKAEYLQALEQIATEEEAITTLIGHTDEVDSLAFSPDGTLLVSGGNWDSNGIRLWDVKTWKMIRTFPSSQPIMDITFSPDGKNIASASYDHTVKLWDVITGNLIWTYTHTNQVHGVDFSPDGGFVAVAPTSGLLDTSNGNEVKRLTMPERSITSVDFHPDGRLLSTTWDNKDIAMHVKSGTYCQMAYPLLSYSLFLPVFVPFFIQNNCP